MRVLAGNSDFKSVREQGYYYIDKSMLAAEVVNASAMVMLITRPRRFGKTLNLSMLEAFFQLETDNRALFRGLAIENDPTAMKYQGAIPTIFLSFKDLASLTWDDCQDKIKALFSSLFLRHKVWIDRAKPQYAEHDGVELILRQDGPLTLYQGALKLLITLLHRATGRPVMILLDEYDTPINAGQLHGYFDLIIDFTRSLLGAALKDNPALERGVLTGILRIAKESIFSGLNNITSYSLLDDGFSSHFGFTSSEMEQVLTDFNLIHQKDDVASWYNGYRIGRHLIYNPWSIINLVSSGGRFDNYWVNTSNNDLIKQLLLWDRSLESGDLAQLLQGRTIRRKLSETITLRDIQPDDVWSLLFYSGYLTTIEDVVVADGLHELKIPNLEVRRFFEDTVKRWLSPVQNWDVILDALLREDLAALEQQLSNYIRKSISYHDLPGPTKKGDKRRKGASEARYHMLFLGMLINQQAYYDISSNRESGEGRYDLVLLPKNHQEAGYIFEFKQTTPADLTAAAFRALEQIRDRQYGASLVFPKSMLRLVHVGIAFSGKRLTMAHLIQQLTPGDLPYLPRPEVGEKAVAKRSLSINEPMDRGAFRMLTQAKVAKILDAPSMKALIETQPFEFGGMSNETTSTSLSYRLLDLSAIEAIGTLARLLVQADPAVAIPAWEQASDLVGWLVLECLALPLPPSSGDIARLPVETFMGAEIALARHDRRPARFVMQEGILKGELAIVELFESRPDAEHFLEVLALEISAFLNLKQTDRDISSLLELVNGALEVGNAIGKSIYLVISDEQAYPMTLDRVRAQLPALKVIVMQNSPEPELKLIPSENQLVGALSYFLSLKNR